MNGFVPYIWLAGAIHFVIVGANFLLPKKLGYRENLSQLPPILRQIFLVHSGYIVFVLAGFGLLCFLFAEDLVGGSRLGTSLSGFISVFWLSRVLVHLFYYDAAVKRRYPVHNLAFVLAISFLGILFAIAAIQGMAK